MKKIFSLFIVIVAFAFNTFAQQNLRDGYEAYTLKNGMKVYLWVDKEMPDVYGQVAVRAGSIDEPADFTGLAHYLEHMLFKGTQQIGALDWEKEKPMYEKIVALYDDLAKLKLPKSKKDKTYAAIQAQRDELMRQINELTVASSHISQGSEFPTLLQSIGSTALNAYTNFDQTVYHNSFPAYQMEKWLKVYYDHFQNPVFREFQAEMENVFEELNMRTPSVDYQQYIAIYENLFKGSNYARGVIGSPEHLKNPSMTPMINFFNTWYVPNNMGLVLVGNFNAEAVKPLIEKTFGQMQSKPLPERKPTVPAPLTKNEKIKIKLGYSPSVVWGYEGVKEGHPDQFKLGFVLSLLNNDYGTGLLDKLMIDGTIGGAYAQMLSQRDCGKIIIQAEPYYDVNGGYYDDDATTEKLVMTEINKLKRGSVPQWLLQSIKDLYLRKIKTYAESSGIKTNILTDVFLFNEDIEDYFNMEAKVKAITLEDVKEVANKYFSGYFTTISFDEGEPKTEQFVKAQIKPLENPDAQYSQYYADFNKIPVSEPIPTYIDFSDVKQKKLFDGGELFYVENKKNDVFLLTLEYQVGTHADKKLEYAAALMNYAGIMGQKNNYELRRELSRYGASYGVGISDNKFVIQVLGNEKDLDKVMNFISLMCVMPDLDKKQIESVMTSEALRRMYEKKIPALVNNALMQWIYYGDQSPYIDRYSSKELIFISQTTGDYNLLIGKEDLTVAIQKITSYPVKVHYTGQKPIEEVAQILQKVPTQKTMLAAQPDFYRDRRQYSEPLIYLLHNPDLQQATVSLYFPTGDYSNDSEVDYAAFNQYFGGGGLNDLFFLNIREKRSLAYGTGGYAAYNPYNKTSYFISQTGTQNDKVAQVIDIAMNLIDSMPVLPSRINDIKTNVKSEYLSSKPSFRAKSQYLDQLRRVGYTDDPAKINMSKIEALTFDNILKVYSEKIKNRPVIIVIYGDQKNIDTKAIESKYGKINRVPVSKIFKGGDY